MLLNLKKVYQLAKENIEKQDKEVIEGILYNNNNYNNNNRYNSFKELYQDRLKAKRLIRKSLINNNPLLYEIIKEDYNQAIIFNDIKKNFKKGFNCIEKVNQI